MSHGERPLYAIAGGTLYGIDVDTRTATHIGPMGEALRGLAFDGDALLGITLAHPIRLLTIDPSTGAVRKSLPLDADTDWTGMTIIPANELGPATPARVLVGRPNDGSLYELKLGTGKVVSAGGFGDTTHFGADLAWVHGSGLFATVEGGRCVTPLHRCLAKLDPANGDAQILDADSPSDITGLSGYRNILWSVQNTGAVSQVDVFDGNLTQVMNAGLVWSDAAE